MRKGKKEELNLGYRKGAPQGKARLNVVGIVNSLSLWFPKPP